MEILDDSLALIYFDFEALCSMSERQVDEMWDDDSLVADNQIVGGQRCTESIHNIGTFGQQYDAQVAANTPFLSLISGLRWDSILPSYTQEPHNKKDSIGKGIVIKATDGNNSC